MQVELGASEGKALTLLSECGDEKAGLRLQVKSFPLIKEIRGNMWHSWSWLHDQGLPLNMEVLLRTCIVFTDPYNLDCSCVLFYY